MVANSFPVYVGYDSTEIIAYHTFCQSVIDKTTRPISFTPLVLNQLQNKLARPWDRLQSTEFSFTRFLVPWLSNYEGWSLYVDCDFIALEPLNDLLDLVDNRYAVMVCKHNYTPKSNVKFNSHRQTGYAKKNWSSLMLFNNALCNKLTPAYVTTATGMDLQQFKWLESEDLLGSIALEWNWLVGEYDFNSNAKMVHYTQGGPWHKGYENSDYAADWQKYRRIIAG